MTNGPVPETVKLARDVREIVWACLPLADDLEDALTAAEHAVERQVVVDS